MEEASEALSLATIRERDHLGVYCVGGLPLIDTLYLDRPAVAFAGALMMHLHESRMEPQGSRGAVNTWCGCER